MVDLAFDLSDIYEVSPVQFIIVHMFAFVCVCTCVGQMGPIKQSFNLVCKHLFW